MASAKLCLSSSSSLHRLKFRKSPLISVGRNEARFVPSSIRSSCHFKPFPQFSPGLPLRWQGNKKKERCAYVMAPATDIKPEDVEEMPIPSVLSSEVGDSKITIGWGLVLSLLLQQKMKIGIALLSLVGCTSCTLSIPVFSVMSTFEVGLRNIRHCRENISKPREFLEALIGVRSEPLWEFLSKIGIIYMMEPVFTIIFVRNMTNIWENVMASLRAHVFRRILIQKVEFFDGHKVGELSGLLTTDLASLKNVVTENITRDRGFRAFSEVAGTILILFSLSAELAPLLALLMLSISFLVALYKRSTLPVFKAHGMAQALISDSVTETFSAIRTVRSFGGEKRQMLMFGKLVLAYKNSGTKIGTLISNSESLTRLMIYVSLMALYCLGGSKVKAGELSVGTMTAFIGYTFTLTFAVQGVVNTLGDLRGSLSSIERINSILYGSKVDESLVLNDTEKGKYKNEEKGNPVGLLYEDEYSEEAGNQSLPYISVVKSGRDECNVAWSGDICLEGVCFSYPLRPDAEVLSDLNLTLRRGTITALVGPSGAGKSTIVQLLARFYEPTRGSITVAGVDIQTFNRTDWARVISIVNQDPILFSVSVGENIAYGLPDEIVSREDIIKAAQAARAHEFIVSLPQGYDTLVGERGSLLSGGQRQRIAIARALLKNAPILILDEATSALDAVSERLVQDALHHLMDGRTTLVIAHRLSTVQNAHQIAVCASGKIIELGTHEELLALNGQYASLVGTQRLAFG